MTSINKVLGISPIFSTEILLADESRVLRYYAKFTPHFLANKCYRGRVARKVQLVRGAQVCVEHFLSDANEAWAGRRDEILSLDLSIYLSAVEKKTHTHKGLQPDTRHSPRHASCSEGVGGGRFGRARSDPGAPPTCRRSQPSPRAACRGGPSQAPDEGGAVWRYSRLFANERICWHWHAPPTAPSRRL